MHQYSAGAHRGILPFFLCAHALRHGFSSAEGGLNQDVPGRGFLFHHIQQQIHAAAGDFFHGLFNSCQAGEGVAPDVNPVKSDDADIFGNGFAVSRYSVRS